jgi:pSer/pThr/pTyr-binding forkhead associated (FHA) protein
LERSRRFTPSQTPSVRAPAPSSGTRKKGAQLVAPARLLTPEGAIDLLDGSVVNIGRDAANELVLEDALTSRRHARIVVLRTGVLLEDAGSKNGVYVNGARVDRAVLLHAGDRILVGTTELSVFSWVS